MKKCIAIVSGGMDSVTLLYQLVKDYEVVGVLSFDYGQRHSKEILFSALNCKKLGIEHHIITLPYKFLFGESSLTSNNEIPEGHYEQENMKSTVVPNRNMIMLSLATAYAISKDAEFIAYGAHSGDHYIYPDCRPEFIDKLNEAIKICDFKERALIAPFSNYTKKDILEIGINLGVDYNWTWTCYVGGDKACGKCGSCQERLEAFKLLNLEDPLEYESREIIKKDESVL
jgi:7-cyano-7-deazaguanine synthase